MYDSGVCYSGKKCYSEYHKISVYDFISLSNSPEKYKQLKDVSKIRLVHKIC